MNARLVPIGSTELGSVPPQSQALARRPSFETTLHYEDRMCLALLAAGVIALINAFVGIAVLVLAFSATWVVAGQPQVRQADERRRRQARDHDRRQSRLAQANLGRHDLNELTALVLEVERARPEEAERLELDALLDHHVEVAIARVRCESALRTIDRAATANAIAADHRGLHRTILEHQLAQWDRCAAMAGRLLDELNAISEFVRLVAQRAAIPALDADVLAIERRLLQLDLDDALSVT